jgi:hypothetical protein
MTQTPEEEKPIAWCWTCRGWTYNAKYERIPQAIPLFDESDLQRHKHHEIDRPKVLVRQVSASTSEGTERS